MGNLRNHLDVALRPRMVGGFSGKINWLLILFCYNPSFEDRLRNIRARLCGCPAPCDEGAWATHQGYAMVHAYLGIVHVDMAAVQCSPHEPRSSVTAWHASPDGHFQIRWQVLHDLDHPRWAREPSGPDPAPG